MNINKLYETKQTVFDLKDLSVILDKKDYNNLKSLVFYYVKKGYLYRIRRGIFVKKDFDVFELACKIYSPSYISFETVLQKENMIFQYDQTIYVASYLSRSIDINYNGNQIHIQYRKIKPDILWDQKGLTKNQYYTIASKDRAISDMRYLKPDFYFDKNDNESK